MLTYAGMGCPTIRLDWLESHPPKFPNQTLAQLFERAVLHEDDGHYAKLIRCTANAMKISAPYDDLPEFRVKQHMFMPILNAMVDSGHPPAKMGTAQFHWCVRGAGFPEAWETTPNRSDRVPDESTWPLSVTPYTEPNGAPNGAPSVQTNGLSVSTNGAPVATNGVPVAFKSDRIAIASTG